MFSLNISNALTLKNTLIIIVYNDKQIFSSDTFLHIVNTVAELHNITLRGTSEVIDPKYFDFQTFFRSEEYSRIVIGHSIIERFFLGKVALYLTN